MYNRKSTFAFEELCSLTGIDFRTELDIAVNSVPKAVDFHAAVKCARTLVRHGIHIPCVLTEGPDPSGNTTIVIQHKLSGFKHAYVTSFVTFDEDLNLIRTDLAVKGITMAQHQSMLIDAWPGDNIHGKMFENVNPGMLVPITYLMAAFTDHIFKLVFNNEYEDDLIHTVLLDGEHVFGEHLILINGHPYDKLSDRQTWCVDKQGIPDLLVLAAILFHREHQDQRNINFVLELPEKASEGRALLGIDAE